VGGVVEKNEGRQGRGWMEEKVKGAAAGTSLEQPAAIQKPVSCRGAWAGRELVVAARSLRLKMCNISTFCCLGFTLG
jgi:hypothetical protein